MAAALVAASVLSLMGLLSALGAWSPGLDLLNHVTPLYAIGGLATMALAARRPRRPTAWLLIGLGLAAALVSAARVAPEWLEPAPDAAPPGTPTVTVLTQNVWDSNPDPHGTARTLAATHADIILLQELQNDRAKIVARDLERLYPYAADCTLVNQWCSLAIISRVPIRAWSFHQGGWKPPQWDRLVMVRASFDSPSLGAFEVVDTKLTHPYTGDQQAGQIRRLTEHVQGLDPARTILAGDFNLTPWTFRLRAVDLSLALVRRTRGLASWPARLPLPDIALPLPFAFLPIDQVYAGRGWRTVSVRRGPATASDHYGVLVTLAPQPLDSRDRPPQPLADAVQAGSGLEAE